MVDKSSLKLSAPTQNGSEGHKHKFEASFCRSSVLTPIVLDLSGLLCNFYATTISFAHFSNPALSTPLYMS